MMVWQQWGEVSRRKGVMMVWQQWAEVAMNRHLVGRWRGIDVRLNACGVLLQLASREERPKAAATRRWKRLGAALGALLLGLSPGPSAMTAVPTAAAGTAAAEKAASKGAPQAPVDSPALLASYEIQGPLPESRHLAYRPRQFVAGAVVADKTWGGQPVDDPGAYAGWDVLPTPNEGIMRIADGAAWLVLRLNRPATLAVVWRADGPVPAWLADWATGGDVIAAGQAWPSYQRQVGAVEVALGGVYDPGEAHGPHDTRNTYWVLLGEADGRPSPTPAVPPGRVPVQPNETCPDWVHDQYVATGPDGRTYATWHPQIDPVYWCYFRHDHGADPARFAPGYWPIYGYAGVVAAMDEPHTGFKSYAFDDRRGYRWLFTHHFGTGSVNRACVRFHDVNIVAAVAGSGQIVADLHFMGDFGKSVVNATEEPLRPPGCLDQAAQADADGSTGERQLPVVTREAIAYEPWRLDAGRTILGLLGGLTLTTTDAVVMCNTVACDRDVPTDGTGTLRFFTYTRGFGIEAPGEAGIFYTDPYGRTRLSAGQLETVRQFIQPGLSVTVPYYGDNQTCYTHDLWTAWYGCDDTLQQGVPTELEEAIWPPN